MTFSELKKKLKSDSTEFPLIKIAVLADSASQLFCQAIKAYGILEKLRIEIWEANYNQIYQTLVDTTAQLYIDKPDFIIINQSSKKLLNNFYNKNSAGRITYADDQISFLKEIIQITKSRIKCNFIILNYAEINDGIFGNFSNKTSSSFTYQLRKLNFGLMELAISDTSINICDISAIQNFVGSNKMVNDKLYINADNVFDIDELPNIAKSIISIINAYGGKFKKCLILDLDNTLWGGIIGDDGLEEIEIGDLGIGKAFTNFQKWILQLKNRGIIIAICSKNTESIAKEPFEIHPEMVLKLSDIAVFVANWNNKADNIRYIQSVLNIGFDSMVFLDDNHMERQIIKQELPLVTVPNLPEDPTEYLSFLYQQNLFETTSFTEDDKSRNDRYRIDADRMGQQIFFTNETDFLKSLEMIADVKPINDFLLPRAIQLTQRSNQFNLRTIRYSEEEMKTVIKDKTKFTLSISLKDKFGDYGLISLLILEKRNNKILFIDTWIMSCRVLKRKVEDFVLNQAILVGKGLGYETLVGEYQPTKKNVIVADHFKNLGFKNSKDHFWELAINNYADKETNIQLK